MEISEVISEAVAEGHAVRYQGLEACRHMTSSSSRVLLRGLDAVAQIVEALALCIRTLKEDMSTVKEDPECGAASALGE